jgi:hypothetical protein
VENEIQMDDMWAHSIVCIHCMRSSSLAHAIAQQKNACWRKTSFGNSGGIKYSEGYIRAGPHSHGGGNNANLNADIYPDADIYTDADIYPDADTYPDADPDTYDRCNSSEPGSDYF